MPFHSLAELGEIAKAQSEESGAWFRRNRMKKRTLDTSWNPSEETREKYDKVNYANRHLLSPEERDKYDEYDFQRTRNREHSHRKWRKRWGHASS